jgi:hypothetical protein
MYYKVGVESKKVLNNMIEKYLDTNRIETFEEIGRIGLPQLTKNSLTQIKQYA